MMFFDRNPNILKWNSEEIVVNYRSAVDGKIHRYFPDFKIRIRKADKTEETLLIEVKPLVQTKPPKEPKKRTKRYLRECETWIVNNCKWEAAKNYALDRGWKFMILTEQSIYGGMV